MDAADNQTVEQAVRIHARPQTVWRFFTDPTRLAQWWGTAEMDASPGGALRVHMHDGPRPVMRGQFVELVPYQRIVFTFGWEPTPGAPDIPPGTSRVEITLTSDGDGTKLTLRHSDLPSQLDEETSDGWAYLLRRLSTTAERAPQH
jgi:uncharacterized protein YndB with AHSA1/START domain